MGFETLIAGFKSSGKTHNPVETADTLRSISYFQIEDLLSEGEIGGLVNGMQSVKLDGTPVANADGSLNFTGVSLQIRPGTQDQASIPGYGSVKNEVAVGTELKSDTPWIRVLSNTELSAFAITLQVDSLQKSDTSNGDINGYIVQYAIDISTDGGAYDTVVTAAFTGKSTSVFQRTTRVDLPKAAVGWNVRVRRLTPNADSATVADTTRVMSITEIIDAKLRYPNSAYVAISGDASQFSNIPARSYVCWGRLIRIPSNYEPKTRAYSGAWDGSFKTAWTNNPAWILYDVIVQNRFGLGDLIDPALMDKWELYRIAQYCDQLVDDGNGGQEPRFTCTVYLQTKADAFRLIGDMGSVFRGVSYWMGGAITTTADMPQDPVYLYTAANVIDGRFTYQSSARKTRFTTALVTYNDRTNSYKQASEYVEDTAGIARYGIQPTNFVAFGSTSQSQARRAGLWTLTTSQIETDSVTFAVGLDGVRAAPGQIVSVQDPNRAGARQGGRISAATASVITVDRAPDAVAVGDILSVLGSDGVSQTRTIGLIAGRSITVTQPFTVAPVAQSVWHVESTTLATQTFRVLNVTEDVGSGKIQFTINAVQHNASKFAHIERGDPIQIPPISRLPVGSQLPAKAVVINSHQVVEQEIANNVMTISWTPPDGGAATYKVEWQKDSGQWIQAGTVSTASVDVVGVYTGTYVARITAFNTASSPSVAALSDPTAILGKTGKPPVLTSLTTTSLVFGIGYDWSFPANSSDTSRTEIWESTTPVRPDEDGTIAYEMGEYSYPTNHTEKHGLLAGVTLYYWGRLVDKAGNIGDWYPTAGAVEGSSSSDASPILDYISGQIDESILGQALKDRIAGIDQNSETIIKQSLALGSTNDDARASRAYIARLDETKATPEEALAIAQQTLGAQLGDLSAVAQTTTEVYVDSAGNAHAFNITKVGVTKNGVYTSAGLAVGVETVNGVAQSQILLEAQRVAIVDNINGTLKAFFVVQAGQTFIEAAFISNASITTAKIADAAITNAKIAGIIQSNDFNAGVSGWRIDKDGGVEFNNGIFRGDLTAKSITGNFQANATIEWSGSLSSDPGGVVMAFSCPAPVRAGETHRPEINCAVVVGRQGGDDASGATLYLERQDAANGPWTAVTSQVYGLGKYQTIANAFVFMDIPQGGVSTYRFRFATSTGDDLNITGIRGRVIGQRTA